MNKVLVIGELCLDIIIHNPKSIPVLGEPVWDEKISIIPGGSVSYAGFMFNALGLNVSLKATVGDDLEGQYLISELSNVGLNTNEIMKVENKSTMKCIAICDGQNERFIGCSPPISGISEKISLPNDLNLIYIAGYLLYPELWKEKFVSILSKAKDRNIKIFLDTQWLPIHPGKVSEAIKSEILNNLDVLFLTSREAKFLTGKNTVKEAAKKLSELGASIIAIKLGEKGSYVYKKGDIFHSQAFPVKVYDSFGGGDVFGAAFSYGILKEWTLKKTSDFANAAAALSISDRDGKKKIPELNEILEFLSNRK